MRRRSFAILLLGTSLSALPLLLAAGSLASRHPLPATSGPVPLASPRWLQPSVPAVPATLTGLGLILTTVLTLGGDGAERRRRQQLDALRQDGRTGMRSRLALEDDLLGWGEGSHRQASILLVVMHLRMLERQAPFRRDENLQALLGAIQQATLNEGANGPAQPLYRVSDSRVGMLLPPQPGMEDRAVLETLAGKILTALERVGAANVRSEDLVVTGQRLSPGAEAPGRIDLHGYAETLARAAGSIVHLLDAGDVERVEHEKAIRARLQTLGAEDIRLEFQPILLLSTPGQFGLEALLRFRPPQLQNEPTGRLVAIAHELGITHRIDALVLGQLPSLLQGLQESPELDARITYIALNISGASYASPQRLDQLIANLRALEIDPARFCLEFTETPCADQPVDTSAVNIASERLTRELRLRIAIDDFGSGLSNYRRICEAWYDMVKLDIDLVSGLSHSFRLQRYVGSLIDTVQALGKTVVCEGVEDHADFTAAVRLGADAIQGHLIASPMDWGAIPRFLAEALWASPDWINGMVAKIRSTDRVVLPPARLGTESRAVPLERQILDNWYDLRSFEEFLLLFVNELKRWGLDLLRLSLAFLPDQDDIDCSQYVWLPSRPAEVRSLRMDRSFLQQPEHLSSALHHIATEARFYRQRLASRREVDYAFLQQLKQQGCSDYLGLRLDSRGISIPVLTIALRGESSFSDEQIQRIMSMSSLLSLLFYTFESERAKKLALLDALTHLPNRRSFDSFLRDNINRTWHQNRSLALALIDIDRFKQVNDNFGHAYGDACLREVARVVGAELRGDHDFAARLGGEEFAVILPDCSSEEAQQVCELLREAVARARVPSTDGRDTPPLTISLGIAVWDASMASAEGSPATVGQMIARADQMLDLADDCLYEAKRQGRNRVVCRAMDP